MSFKQYLKDSEESYKEEVEKTLKKLPKSHSALIKDFKYEFVGSNTLKNDDDHVGLIDTKRKKIVIAAPFYYSREHVILHELAHLIWLKIIKNDTKKQWKKIAKNTKLKKEDRQNEEELFAHAYSNYYDKNPVVKFNFPEWRNFIKSLPH